MKIAILDTETTGLDHATTDVLEISIIDGDGKTLLDTLVKPVKNTEWPEAQRIHGITPEMIAAANPPTLVELMPQIEKILSEVDTLVIYNVDYDLPFLTEAFRKAGVTPPRPSIECCMIKYADHRGIPGRHAGGSKWHKLIDAAEYVGHTWEGQAHRALADCQATLSVWNWLQRQTQLKHEDEHMASQLISVVPTLMEQRLSEARANGRSGWWKPEECSTDCLRDLLLKSAVNRDWVDAANFAAMLAMREDWSNA